MNNIFEEENTTFELNGCEYVLDMDEIFKYIYQSRDKDVIEKEITDQYEMSDGEVKPRQTVKLVKEVTTPMTTEIDNIRYDFVKTLIIMLLNNEETIGGMPAAYGTCLAFNTLYAKNLIKKIKQD
jgi:hypothetical protein